MSTFAQARPDSIPGWRRAGLLAAGAFASQSLICVIVWLLVNDFGVSGTFYNDDFYEWCAISGLAAALLAALAGMKARRWWVAGAIATGCLLALFSAIVLIVGFAAFNSA